MALLFAALYIIGHAFLMYACLPLLITILARQAFSSWRFRHIPGPFTFPLFGNLPQFALRYNFRFDLLTVDYQRRFGPVFSFSLGPSKVLMITDLDTIREVGLRKFSAFTNRPALFRAANSSPRQKLGAGHEPPGGEGAVGAAQMISKARVYQKRVMQVGLLNDAMRDFISFNLLALDNEDWKGVRRAVTAVFHSDQALMRFTPVMQKAIDRMMTEISHKMEESSSRLSPSAGGAVGAVDCEIHGMFAAMALDVVGSTVFGVDFGQLHSPSDVSENADEGRKLLGAVQSIFKGAFNIQNPYVILQNLAPSSFVFVPAIDAVARMFPTRGMKESAEGFQIVHDYTTKLVKQAKLDYQGDRHHCHDPVRSTAAAVVSDNLAVNPGAVNDKHMDGNGVLEQAGDSDSIDGSNNYANVAENVERNVVNEKQDSAVPYYCDDASVKIYTHSGGGNNKLSDTSRSNTLNTNTAIVCNGGGMSGPESSTPIDKLNRDDTGSNDSLLALVWKARERAGVSAELLHIWDDVVAAQAALFFLAGYDTTANSLAVTCHFLSHDARVLKKLQAEVDNIKFDQEAFGADDKNRFDSNDLSTARRLPAMQAMQKFPYATAAIKEAQRLLGPAAVLSRQAGEATELMGGKVQIRKNDVVFLTNSACHRNPEYWPEPERYIPERHMTGAPEYALQNHRAWLVFGLGPRMCPAYNFAMEEAVLALVRLVQLYDIHPQPGQDRSDKLEMKQQGTLTPAHGVHVQLVTRK